MSGPLRVEFAGALYHVAAREDDFREDGDRATFLYLPGREIAKQRWCLCAYCLMGNHYHLLMWRCAPAYPPLGCHKFRRRRKPLECYKVKR